MKIYFAIISIVLCCGLSVTQAQTDKQEWIFQPEDQRLAEQKLQSFSYQANEPIGDLVTGIGLSFLGTPYVAATLENGLDEKLVINLRQLDCTTFAENCLALATTVKMGKTDFISFATQLERIRYRDGQRNRYPSRLHYFSEWIYNNHQKQLINASINQNGVKTGKAIRFMSTHPNSYPVLKAHPEVIASMVEQESKLTQAGMYYFPGTDLRKLYNNLQHGDIVGLTSTIEGLDINHVGIVIRKGDQFHLLHASQSEKKVVVSESPLADFLKPTSKNSGIMIARPIFDDEQIVH